MAVVQRPVAANTPSSSAAGLAARPAAAPAGTQTVSSAEAVSLQAQLGTPATVKVEGAPLQRAQGASPVPQTPAVVQPGSDYGELAEPLVDAVKFAHSMWRLQAHFQDIQIMAITAIGVPGCLTGPMLAPLVRIAPTVSGWTGDQEKLRTAVADAVSDRFDSWRGGVTVPGLPWYPSFAAWPGPTAPPTPNIPFPLIACVSSHTSEITIASLLQTSMTEHLDPVLRGEASDELFAAVAQNLAFFFLTWLAQQQVMLVMGYGPVPTFAPPYVPVGPVMNGSILPAPGHLSA